MVCPGSCRLLTGERLAELAIVWQRHGPELEKDSMTMKLYLVQNGEAKSKADAPQ